MGKALSGELSFPCDRSCFLYFVLLWREFRKFITSRTHINVIFRNNVLKWAKHVFGIMFPEPVSVSGERTTVDGQKC